MNTLASATAMAGARGGFLADRSLRFFDERDTDFSLDDDTYQMIYITELIVKHFLSGRESVRTRIVKHRRLPRTFVSRFQATAVHSWFSCAIGYLN
jgi:hypothetical protein